MEQICKKPYRSYKSNDLKFKVVKYFDKIWYFLVYSIALLPILPRGIESILIVSLFLTSLILFFLEKKNQILKSNLKIIAVLATIPIIYFLGLLYSYNIGEGIKFIIRVLPLLVFPMIFGFFSTDRLDFSKINIIFNLFILSLILGLAYIQTILFLNLDIVSDWEYRQAFEKLTDVHGTYYSLWLAFGIFILVGRIINCAIKRKLTHAILYLIISLYFFYWQLVLGARLPVTITIILILIMFFMNLKTKKRTTIFILGSIFLASIFFITSSTNYFNRAKELSNYDFSLPEGNYHIKQGKITNEQIRTGIYYCSFKLLKKSWIFGYGIGDVNDKLQNCYQEKINSNVYQIFKFNTHNQYVHILLSNGIIGLIFFFISLLLPFLIAYKNSNALFLVFSLLIFTAMLTENVLSRHDGVLFYSFFNSIFVFTIKTLQKK